MTEIFIDTNVCLDLLAQREPHYTYAASLFTLADKGEIKLYVSSLSFSNLNYLLSRQYSMPEARRILSKFKVLVKVLPVDDKVIELALHSNFKDFEDAIQYFTAIESGIKLLLTRNLKDYKKAEIQVQTPELFLKGREM
ncbi:type II toxin-antitoxin system VapC family toxin [Rufibacter ruber]|uniref:type II toxin-antitoxin system VapC family toxin n=1 Tax=Rufibacter ruber TaxID=1783499 RepID=UPI00082C55EA|nr:PIN domain-containing protein [Rufibacter ruber]